MGLKNRFAMDDPYVLSQQIQTSNNNQVALNTSFAENDHLRATSVVISSQAVNTSTGNPLPTTTATAQATVGAAIGGVGQTGTYSEEPGGGGYDGGGDGSGGGTPYCFLGHTQFTLWMPNNILIRVPIARLFGRNLQLTSLSFDEDNNRVHGKIKEVFRTIKHDYLHVTFEDDYATDVMPEHRYWTPEGYVCIKELLGQNVYTEDSKPCRVKDIHRVKATSGIYVYNAHIEQYENYCADGKRVHNLKPAPDAFESTNLVA